ncbi:MAG TPA: FadD3 family acyl-CoA ligase [Streptosporangiaceae bacterium]|nr:FadD3 family acyl-CoA ligase [Streptosporangiaceae bacterium]
MPSTIPQAMRRAAGQFGDLVAIAEPGGGVSRAGGAPVRLSYQELHKGVRQVAGALAASGIQPGDRVAIWSPNTHHWVLAALGSLYAGATLVPINTRYTGHEAFDVIDRTRARVLFVAGPFLGVDRLQALRNAAGRSVLPELIVRIPVESDEPSWDDFIAREADDDLIDARADAVTPDSVSDILFTSGTTGRSKGAMSAHRQALDVARAWAECAELTSADRYLIVNPFFHSFGYKAGILACLLTGATMVPQLIFDPGASIRLIEEAGITVFPGAPTIYTSILDHPERPGRDLSSLRLAVTGAAVVPVALVERMRAELSFDTVLTAYGLTEAVVATMCRAHDDDKTIATTSGRAAAGFEVKIADPAGEILLRGPNVMLGYLDDEAATAEAIDPDGWLHTGDVGRLDERGYLTITDRLKDMYICGGFNVYPAEIEQVLARHPAVAESVVIGVPDDRLGEVGKAFVVRRPGAETSATELIEFSRERLANFKVPRQVEFRNDLPRNPAGKPLKRLLRGETQ